MSDNFDWTKLLDVDGLVDTGPPKESAASIPFMITQAQEVQLRELGYSDAVILAMTPEDARRLLNLSK